MADGKYCSLSLDKLNEIYEIANEPRGVAVAKMFAPSNTFWDFIAYQSQIRNPALRDISKIISNLLFAKDQTSKKVKTNPCFHFITIRYERRLCLMHGMNKKDRSGSMLGPLFKHFGIDLSKYKVNTEIQYLDIKLIVFNNIRFLPPPELLCTDPRSAAPDADMEDVEDITPEADPSYDLEELADVTNDQAYRLLGFFFTRRFAEKRRVIGQRARKGSLRNDRTCAPLGRYVATEFELWLGRYVATELESKLGRYVATKLEQELGRYIATERLLRSDQA
ncbi:hypothetical protein F2Q69_00043138 [Brassica cretica]|uniref:Uncharacterized protein n=1 Tax=Brassica cretica TaxID=69181 RepID=A0A8S9NMN3_BRACR|nr:hypothetical protein F2Q69_00043138 [Brassica cretica]